MCGFCKIGQTQRTAYIQGKAQLSRVSREGGTSGKRESGRKEGGKANGFRGGSVVATHLNLGLSTAGSCKHCFLPYIRVFTEEKKLDFFFPLTK